MKLFLDRNRTLLPRIDMIYLLTRALTLVGLLWFALVDHAMDMDRTVFLFVSGTFLLHLIVMTIAVAGKFDLKLAYFSAILYDIILVPLFVYVTGGINSSFYLLFFLTVSVAAYVLTFWFATAVTGIVTISYFVIIYGEFTMADIFDVAMRLGFLWTCFLAISYASDHLRRSERRLLKLFDTLNMRTSELEKSQAQLEMIYENTRALAAILETDGVVKEVMRIMGRTLQFEHFAVIFRHQNGDFYYRARSISGRQNLHLKAISRDATDLIRKVREAGESIRVRNLGDRTDYVPLREDVKSVIIVPMTSHGNTHGLLIAESCNEDAFSEREEQMLSIVARSAGLALENAALHKRTEELTIIDDLTGAYNYRFFVRKLEEEKKRATRYDLPLSLIMVDIDWFKKLNDSYGHEVGNVVLTHLAGIIKQSIRDVDIFARYGGEEFVIILPQTDQREASTLGERIRHHVESAIIDAGDGGRVKITVSVGVTSFPENGKSAEDLVSIADQALYRAKGSGKNLVCIV